ncbi:MAG: hypothetical protein ACK4LA_06955, partial [Aquificaceae bacterium]
MKKLMLALFGSTVIFAQDIPDMRILDGIGQAQKSIELAKLTEADKIDPYHFEKARINKDIASILASTMDEIGAKVFLVKSFSATSKAMSGKYTLDELSLVEKETNLTESLNIDLNLMTSKLLKLREEKALTCTPVELARAEAYYDALLYELSKEKPSPTHLIDFYQKGIRNIDIAFEKIEIA